MKINSAYIFSTASQMEIIAAASNWPTNCVSAFHAGGAEFDVYNQGQYIFSINTESNQTFQKIAR